jgi:predicted membrane channel-forming protein YqfA (hemolysin III family)
MLKVICSGISLCGFLWVPGGLVSFWSALTIYKFSLPDPMQVLFPAHWWKFAHLSGLWWHIFSLLGTWRWKKAMNKLHILWFPKDLPFIKPKEDQLT